MQFTEIEKLVKEKEKELELLSNLGNFLDQVTIDPKLIKRELGYRVPDEDILRLKKVVRDWEKYTNLFDNNINYFKKRGSEKEESKKLGLKKANYKVIELEGFYFILKLATMYDKNNSVDGVSQRKKEYYLQRVVRFFEKGERLTLSKGLIEVRKGDYTLVIVNDANTNYILRHENKKMSYKYLNYDEIITTPLCKNEDELLNTNSMENYEAQKSPFLLDLNENVIGEVYHFKKNKVIYSIINLLKTTKLEESIINNEGVLSMYLAVNKLKKMNLEFTRTKECYEELNTFIPYLSNNVLFSNSGVAMVRDLDEAIVESPEVLKEMFDMVTKK